MSSQRKGCKQLLRSCSTLQQKAHCSNNTELRSKSNELSVNNSGGSDGGGGEIDGGNAEERRPSLDLSALERKAVGGGITRFHCRYFLRQRNTNTKKQVPQRQHDDKDEPGKPEYEEEADNDPEAQGNSLRNTRSATKET